MPTRKGETRIHRLALLADTHILSRYGLCPPEFRPSNAGPSGAYMDYMWSVWTHFIKHCPPIDVVILNGDAVEGPTPCNRSGPDAIDVSPHRQVDAGIATLGPLRDKCKHFWMTRGSSFHVGKDYEIEEALARELKADQWSERRHTGFVLEKTWQGLSINATHHTTFGAVYRGTIMDRTALFAAAGEAQCKVNPSHIIIRSHTHSSGIGKFHRRWYVQTPCWKLCNPYALQKLEYYRASMLLDIGAIIVSTTGNRDLWWNDEEFSYKPYCAPVGALA